MSKPRHVSRREFLQTAGAVAGGVALSGALASRLRAAVPPASMQAGFSVNITSDPADPIAASAPAQWAIAQLRDALIAKGVAIRPQADLAIAVMGQLILQR